MRISTPFLLLILGLLGCQPSSRSDGAKEPISRLEVFRQIDEHVNANPMAYATLGMAIDSIGHRLTGSENGAQAEQFVYDHLKSYQLPEVEYFPFSVTAWGRDSVSLSIAQKGTDPISYKVVSLAHSPVKYEGIAEIVDVGNGLRKDFESHKQEVIGKFVLVNLRLDGSDPKAKNLHRTEKTALAMKYGATGVIFANAVPGNVLLTGAASVTGEVLPIPAVCIGKESGEALRELLSEGMPVEARVKMKNHAEQIEARNVIARIPGRDLPDETILIGGHLDSWDLSTGAIDNGIGAFAILDIARVFQDLGLRPRRTVEFVFFMGEEQGLLGSEALVDHLQAEKELDRIKYVINLDMTGNPIGFRSMGRPEAENWLSEIGADVQKIDTLFRNTMGNRAGLHSDHQPFMLKGIPILALQSNLDPSVYQFYHSDGDDFSLVDADHVNNTVRFVGMILYAIADADSIPASRLSHEDTREFLIRQDLKEKLVLGQEWEWED